MISFFCFAVICIFAYTIGLAEDADDAGEIIRFIRILWDIFSTMSVLT